MTWYYEIINQSYVEEWAGEYSGIQITYTQTVNHIFVIIGPGNT